MDKLSVGEHNQVNLCLVARSFSEHVCISLQEVMPSTGEKTSFKVTNPSEGPQLSAAQLKFMKLIEAQNLQRINKLTSIRRRNTLTGWGLGAAVIGIYSYSMFAVKQEKFLDDFDEPEKVIDLKE